MVVDNNSKHSSYKTSLLKDLYLQQQSGQYTDLTIYSGGQKVSIHSVILKNCSPLLNSFLESACSCSQPAALILPTTCSSVLSSFVSLLYTGYTPNIAKDMVEQLMFLSKELAMVTVMCGSDDSPNELDDVEEQTDPRVSVLKIETHISDERNDEIVGLHFPNSRIERKFSDLNKIDALGGFNGRVQEEYNTNPVGQYMGPYDQNKDLKLSVQLPKSDLDFDKYTEFRHLDSAACRVFGIKKSYHDFDDLNKIDALRITDIDISEIAELELSYDDDDRLFYTCQNKVCKIPCPCSLCSTDEGQCSEHRIQHMELFDEEAHAISIRSTEDFCRNDSFFLQSYILKYPGIPLKCTKCRKDLVHHHSYHLNIHDNCKFCSLYGFKLKAKSAYELKEAEEEAEYRRRTVCPHCDRKFCEPHTRKKHMEFEHQKAPYKCDTCAKTFHSKQSKQYHELINHSSTTAAEKHECKQCEKTFPSKVGLRNHEKYVHSDGKLYCKNSSMLSSNRRKH